MALLVLLPTAALPADEVAAIVEITDSVGVVLDGARRPEETASRPIDSRTLRTICNAPGDLEASGCRPTLEGVFWLQGEHDAFFGPYRPRHGTRLKSLRAGLREDLSAPELFRFIVDHSMKSPWGEKRIAAMNAQLTVIARDDAHVSYVETGGLPDKHMGLGTEGTLLLGESFAGAYEWARSK